MDNAEGLSGAGCRFAATACWMSGSWLRSSSLSIQLKMVMSMLISISLATKTELWPMDSFNDAWLANEE